MFSNFIYFIIVLLIYSTYQPSSESNFAPLDTLWFFIGILIFFISYTRIQFKRIENGIARESFVRIEHRFQAILTRQSILAIVLFAVYVYGLSLPSFLIDVPLFVEAPTLLALLFLAVFVGHLAVVWALAYGPYEQLHQTGVSRNSYVWSQISFSIPVLLPWLVLSGLMDVINALPFSLPKKVLSTTEGSVAYFMFFLFIVAVTAPAMIQRFWRCVPLEQGEMRDRIEAVCRKAGIEYANIMYWPIFGGRMITAGVMGLVKRFRYILVTRALLRSLDPVEIDAVIAHEIGHVKRKHLIFYLVFFTGFMLMTYASYDLIFYFMIYMEPVFRFFTDLGFNQVTLVSIFLSVSFVLLFLVYFRFIFGYFMRNFERQADGYVYALFESSRPLISTLEKIAVTSGQPPDRPNWHHFSITERIRFLARCEADRSVISEHDNKVKKSIIAYLVAMLIFGGFGYSLNYGETGRFLADRLNQKIEKRLLLAIEEEPTNHILYRELGDLYFQFENWAGVRQAYEDALRFNPNDPHVLNNLAWFYATCDEDHFRNPARSLELARQAASILKEAHILDTLAEAYYVNRMYQDAIDAETLALQLARDNRAYYEAQLERFRKATGY